MLYSAKHSGFTLIELMISVAIVGLLTAIMFSNFSNEKDRNTLKTAVHQFQTDVQTMQTNSQAGFIVQGSTPSGFGMHLDAAAANTAYTLFADRGASPNNQLDAGDSVLNTRSLGTNVIVKSITGTTADSALDVVFLNPNGKVSLIGKKVSDGTADTIGASGSSATVVLMQTKLKICYAITIAPTVGIVSPRQLTSCP